MNIIPNKIRHNSQNVLFEYFIKKSSVTFPFAATLHSKIQFSFEIGFIESSVKWNMLDKQKEEKKPFCVNLSNQTSIMLGWQEEF